MAFVGHLWLQDYRNYTELDLELSPGRVIISGDNGQGKSNLLEAIGWLGGGGSFRRASTDALIRVGADEAIIRADVQREERALLVEVGLHAGRSARVQVNKQKLDSKRALPGLVPVTVFAPDDLELVKGGPGERREYLDDLLVSLKARNGEIRVELDRVLKQRNALLKQAGGPGGLRGPDRDVFLSTLEVWDAALAATGDEWARRRAALVERLVPELNTAYAQLVGSAELAMSYEAPWRAEGLAAHLERMRDDELRRGVSLVGPHRDELAVTLNGMPTRTHASQGEQRSVALALRMAGHTLAREVLDTSPVLLLDDVFSELDTGRAAALVEHLAAEQTIITTAVDPPDSPVPVHHFTVAGGVVTPVGSAS